MDLAKTFFFTNSTNALINKKIKVPYKLIITNNEGTATPNDSANTSNNRIKAKIP